MSFHELPCPGWVLKKKSKLNASSMFLCFLAVGKCDPPPQAAATMPSLPQRTIPSNYTESKLPPEAVCVGCFSHHNGKSKSWLHTQLPTDMFLLPLAFAL